MRVGNILSIFKSQIINKKQVDSPKETKLDIKDTVKISEKGKLLQKDNADFLIAKNALSQLPSVREDKIKEAQEKIKNNTYNSASFRDELLNKIFNSGLFSNEIKESGYKSILNEIPDVREEKVNQIKERIKGDYYNRKDVIKDLSEKILKEFGI